MSESGGDNPYEAPAVELTQAPTGDRGGSIEATLNGQAQLEVGDTISEAWRRTKGIKTIVLGAGIAWFAIIFGIMVVFAGTGIVDPQSTVSSTILQIVLTAIGYPIIAGIIMVGVRQSVDAPVEFGQVFGYMNRIVPLAILGIVVSILTTIGYLLLVLPGIYLSIALMLAIPLCVDKDMGLVESLTTSIKLVNKEFLNVFLLVLAIVVISIASFITIIGWIWGIPLTMMIYAIIYRQLAGVDSV